LARCLKRLLSFARQIPAEVRELDLNAVLNLRGEVLPFLRLREMFQIPGEVPARERVVVIQHGELRAGIVVDRLLGEFQTVIKPLGKLFR
jgi:two-component system chemotaxis sensor kinase CheA